MNTYLGRGPWLTMYADDGMVVSAHPLPEISQQVLIKAALAEQGNGDASMKENQLLDLNAGTGQRVNG